MTITSARLALGAADALATDDAADVPVSRAGSADSILSAMRPLQEASDLAAIADHAAAALLRLTAATAASAYVESTDGEVAFAAAGSVSAANTDRRAYALKTLAASVQAVALPLANEPCTRAVPFRSDVVRGAILIERRDGSLGDAEDRVLLEFAPLVGIAAGSLLRNDRSRLFESMETIIADTVCEGVLTIRAGKIVALNRAGAQMLAVTAAEVVGGSLHTFWPELARAMEDGRSLDREHMRAHDVPLSVTLRVLPEGAWATGAVATFVPDLRAPAVRRARSSTPPPSFGGLIGVSAAIERIRDIARVASQSSSDVLIEGESGVGKEVLAQAIHASGPRAAGPFVGVLCAAIPRELLESELFGYEAGSFTGANPRGRAGKFELAQGGSLLLDDIVDMPLEMQAKLLRVLQERVVTRLGSSRARPIGVRVIATSNRIIQDVVREGRFRADLFYRLNVLNISIPPLRERPEDIRPLAQHFLLKHAAGHGSKLQTIGAEALRALQAHPWPGNIRELEHCIEREIHFASPEQTCLNALTRQLSAPQPRPGGPRRTLRELERELYAAAMADAAGDISRAARDLGVSRGKLYRKLKAYGLLPH